MLRLESCETTMCEIADSTVAKRRLLVNVQPCYVDLLAFGDYVAVPEPSASGATFQEIVQSVENRAGVRADNVKLLILRLDVYASCPLFDTERSTKKRTGIFFQSPVISPQYFWSSFAATVKVRSSSERTSNRLTLISE